MKVFVRAKPKSKKEYVKQIDETHFEIAVHALPEKGKANGAIAKQLAKHLGVPYTHLTLVGGAGNKEKIFEITP